MILKVDHLSKEYIQGQTRIAALNDVNFEVDKGETVAIVGPSGSGKTTLLSILTGLDSPTQGNVFINEDNVSNMGEKQLAQFRAKNIGIVFQQFHLMSHLTAQENVQLPLEILGLEDVEERAKEALTQVGLESRLTHKPDQLSGGEKQRVAIARAFVSEPSILFADEPSGNLDQNTGVKVLDLLFDQVSRRNMTMILVTHDSELANRCGRQMLMKAGQLG